MSEVCTEHVKEIEICLELSQGPDLDLDDWGSDNSKFSVLDVYHRYPLYLQLLRLVLYEIV